MAQTGGEYDIYSVEYAAYVAERERNGAEADRFGILPHLLDLLGPVVGQRVLDAGCGEGYLARVLAAHGARVMGVDLSPRLIQVAQHKDLAGEIEYRMADVTRLSPDDIGQFDAVASYLVLNDVVEYPVFAAALAALLKPGGRMVHAFNNPYGAVIRKHVANYFDSGATSPYLGLWKIGIKTHNHHRTLEEYLDAFLNAGLRLMKLADLSEHVSVHDPRTILPEGYVFPVFMLMAFSKPEEVSAASSVESQESGGRA